MEKVSDTRFVLLILSVGLNSGYDICTLKVLWYRNTGECLGACGVWEKIQKRDILLESSVSF